MLYDAKFKLFLHFTFVTKRDDSLAEFQYSTSNELMVDTDYFYVSIGPIYVFETTAKLKQFQNDVFF
jgi:hypothetical protein